MLLSPRSILRHLRNCSVPNICGPSGGHHRRHCQPVWHNPWWEKAPCRRGLAALALPAPRLCRYGSQLNRRKRAAALAWGPVSPLTLNTTVRSNIMQPTWRRRCSCASRATPPAPSCSPARRSACPAGWTSAHTCRALVGVPPLARWRGALAGGSCTMREAPVFRHNSTGKPCRRLVARQALAAHAALVRGVPAAAHAPSSPAPAPAVGGDQNCQYYTVQSGEQLAWRGRLDCNPCSI